MADRCATNIIATKPPRGVPIDPTAGNTWRALVLDDAPTVRALVDRVIYGSPALAHHALIAALATHNVRWLSPRPLAGGAHTII